MPCGRKRLPKSAGTLPTQCVCALASLRPAVTLQPCSLGLCPISSARGPARVPVLRQIWSLRHQMGAPAPGHAPSPTPAPLGAPAPSLHGPSLSSGGGGAAAGEDFALGMELKQAGRRGGYLAERLASGEAPLPARDVERQRSRWAKGHMQVSGWAQGRARRQAAVRCCMCAAACRCWGGVGLRAQVLLVPAAAAARGCAVRAVLQATAPPPPALACRCSSAGPTAHCCGPGCPWRSSSGTATPRGATCATLSSCPPGWRCPSFLSPSTSTRSCWTGGLHCWPRSTTAPCLRCRATAGACGSSSPSGSPR
jgi:hypothetical protein